MTEPICHHLISRWAGTDHQGRPVLIQGHICGQPAITDRLCGPHLNESTGLTPPSRRGI